MMIEITKGKLIRWIIAAFVLFCGPLRVLEDRGVITRENRIFPKRGQTSNLYEIGDIEPSPQDGRDNGNPETMRFSGVLCSLTVFPPPVSRLTIWISL